MKHLMPNDPRHEISRSTGGHFKRRHKRSPHRSRDVPLPLHCQHRQCSLHIPLRLQINLIAIKPHTIEFLHELSYEFIRQFL
jgi:hypothetical protein